ncbi:MAG: hypothetical protein HQ559_12955 [Lentisphaerae bacterium]|nr:hypothetical protein [Lentisphaerota bacterium]
MNVILDECLPRRMIRDLPAHAVTTIPKQGWASLTNGELLGLVQPEFDVFITIDRNIVHQQNLTDLKICLIVLHAPNSRYETLQPLVPDIRGALDRAEPGAVIHIGN